MQELYADGGVVVRNPSPFGGVYAWCLVEDGQRVKEFVGYFAPQEVGVSEASNNNAELLALLDGLEKLPPGWKGRVNSDSQVALNWVFSGWSRKNVPTPLRVRLEEIRRSGKLSGLEWRLLQGHPTKADLKKGIGKARNLPVSEHNVWCDKACQARAKEIKETFGEAVITPAVADRSIGGVFIPDPVGG